MNFRLRRLPQFILVFFALFHVAIADGPREFRVRGVVRGDYQDGMITIEHEAIPGFMPAMTMPFYVSAEEGRALQPGMRVEFRFIVGENSRATDFKVTGRVADKAAASPSARRRLREGDKVEAFTLRDQTGAPLTAAVLDGRYTVVTFVFTRCPVPEFCPLLMRKFRQLQDELRGVDLRHPVQLLSVTIDPAHDTPEVLRAYGEAAGADFDHWRFATGDVEEVLELTRKFAVRVERNGATIDHTLATAVIGPDRGIITILRGNRWEVGDVLNALKSTGGQHGK